MTTHAPLRSPWTKALSVYHVRGLGDGDAPTSLIKIQGWQASAPLLGYLCPLTTGDLISVRGLGGCAASHVEGTVTARAFPAILLGRPWVVVTVPALVPCARLGDCRFFRPSRPPRLSVVLGPASGDRYDTPYRLLP